ncbi:MAG: 4'-phosphopantetheinyl transferase superfamily protein [Neomegalonema sp.]|nr:4'-phosphopantetheinyl transferase superfamily protein [Neomegalonema sp.]
MDDAIELDLWLWPLRVSRAPDPVLLSPEENERARRFRTEALQAQYILCRSRVRRVLGRYLGVRAEDVPLRVGANGKPELKGAELSFNLSHSADLAALAVARAGGVRVGVDIEAIRPVRENVSELAFSPAERQELGAATTPAAQLRLFFAGWTRKEAFVKALGAGLTADLASFDVALTPDAAEPSLTIRDPNEAGAGWRLLSFSPRADIAGAVAIEAGGRTPQLRIRAVRGVDEKNGATG